MAAMAMGAAMAVGSAFGVSAQAYPAAGPNDAAFYETTTTTCVKIDPPGEFNLYGSLSDGGVKLNQPVALLVVKGGSDGGDGFGNADYRPAVAGTKYFAPENNSDRPADVSHWIVCVNKPTPPVVEDEPTTTTAAPTTTAASTTTAAAAIEASSTTSTIVVGSEGPTPAPPAPAVAQAGPVVASAGSRLLPSTGSESNAIAALGAFLLASGLALALTTRRSAA